MTSEIRTNSLKSRAGLSTVTLTDSGPMFSGITTFVDNSSFNIGTGSSIFSPATNTLTFGTNSNERVRIDSSGRMGLGTNSPEEILHVKAASETVNSRDGVIFQSSSSLAADTGLPLVFSSHIGNDPNYPVASIAGRKENASSGDGAGYLQFATGSSAGAISEKARIDSSGQLSIGGNSSVGTKVHVENSSGDAHIRLRGSANCGVLYTRHSDGALIGYTGSGNAVNLGSSNLGISASLSGGNIIFQTGGTASSNERLRIQSDGDVGIGTVSVLADTKVHILDTTAGNYRSVAIDSYATNGSTLIYRQNGSQVLSIGSGGSNNLSGSNVTHGLIRSEVATVFAVGNSEKLRIASDGVATFSATNINVNRNAGDPFIALQTSGTSNVSLYGGSSTGFRVFTKPSGGSLTERLRITTDGKVGINRTTPVAPITARRTDAGGTGTSGVIAEFANSSGYGVWFGQSSASGASWGATTGDFYWNTGGLSSQVERVRIKSDGKVRMTTTSSATRGLAVVSPATQINFGATEDKGGFLLSTTDGQFSLSGGGYWGGTNWVATASASTQIRHDGGTGPMAFCFNTGLTAGNNFTPTVRLEITPSGNMKLSDPGITFSDNSPYFPVAWSGTDGYNTVFTIASTGYANLRFRGYVNTDSEYTMGVGAGIFYMAYDDINNSHRITVNASGVVSGDFNDTSDEKLKKNITSLADGAIDRIRQLRPVNFDWKRESDLNGQSGFIAQEVKTVIPDLVVGEEYVENSIESVGYSVNTNGLVAHLTKAVQELITKVETLEQDNIALRARVTNLEGN